MQWTALTRGRGSPAFTGGQPDFQLSARHNPDVLRGQLHPGLPLHIRGRLVQLRGFETLKSSQECWCVNLLSPVSKHVQHRFVSVGLGNTDEAYTTG